MWIGTSSSTAALAIGSSTSAAGTMLATAATVPETANTVIPAARFQGAMRDCKPLPMDRLESLVIQIPGKFNTDGGRFRSTGGHQARQPRADRGGGNGPQAQDRAR